jgi:diguanylate cyclase (GGDEF)-like protein
MNRSRAIHLYVGLLVAVAAPLLGLVLVSTDWSHVLDHHSVVLVLACAVILGELKPIMISHGDDSVDVVTISCCFSLALLVHGPLAIGLLVQAVALVADDVRVRRSPIKMAFNHATFVLSLLLFRGVFCLLTGRALLTAKDTFSVSDLVASLVAALVFYAVNQALTTFVLCLASGLPFLPRLWHDLRAHASSFGVLLALAPVVVHALTLTPFLVLLLLMPIAAVHRSALLAVERERQALHDSLTGLPNRALFHERAKRAVAERGDGLLAVMVMDLDHFKEINDTLGHHVGDQLLVAVGERVRGVVRPDDLVARLGGDEFALLCEDLPSVEAAEEIAARVVKAMEASYTVDGVRLDVGSSLGFALSPEHGDHAETLLQRADVALYAAKVRRGAWAAYVPEEDGHSVQKLALLGDLREGVARDELVVHYQPLCDTATGEVLSVEALVRWQHPTQGLVFPDRFIHIAESTGLIAPLTHVVLQRTLEQLAAWDAEGLHLDAAVNLSARQLTDLELPEHVAHALAQHGLEPRRLVLEVTESHIIADATRADVVLRRLREVGVRLAVDDFGTGYSSLTQLRGLAVDVLKIDRSFVMHMATDENDALIVRSTIDLGHNLGLRVVAEGVEDAAALEQLRELGCDAVQGYYLCRPVPPDRLLAWARERALTASSPAAP